MDWVYIDNEVNLNKDIQLEKPVKTQEYQYEIKIKSQITKQIKDDHKPVWYYIFGYILYVLALLPFAYLISYTQEFDTQNTTILNFYERETYFTTYISPGKLIYWMTLAIVGFTFVVVVNLGNTRKNPFASIDGSYKDIKTLVPVAFSLFVLSSLIFLRDKHDMQRGCEQVDPNFVAKAAESGIIQTRIGSQLNFGTQAQNYQQNEMTPFAIVWKAISDLFFNYQDSETHCHLYSRMEVFKYNYFYLIVYFIGLNFTHLDQPPFNQITLEWDIMKNWPWYIWLIFLGMVSFILINVGYLLTLYVKSEVIKLYIFFILAIIGFFVGGTLYYKDKKLHIHHYCIGYCIVLLIGYQSKFTIIIKYFC